MYILGYTDAQSAYQFMKMRRILHGATEHYQWSCQRGHRSRLNLYKFHVYKKLVRNIHAFRRIWMDEDVTDWRKYSILLLLPTVSNKLQRQFCQSLRLYFFQGNEINILNILEWFLVCMQFLLWEFGGGEVSTQVVSNIDSTALCTWPVVTDTTLNIRWVQGCQVGPAGLDLWTLTF